MSSRLAPVAEEEEKPDALIPVEPSPKPRLRPGGRRLGGLRGRRLHGLPGGSTFMADLVP